MTAAALLAGCAHKIQLIEDGKVHNGTYQEATRQMEVVIDGERFAGTVMPGSAVGFGTGFVGTKMFTTTTTTSTGVYTGVLTSDRGRVMNCQVNASMFQGSGMCQTTEGRTFAVKLGQ
jgi:hypothetical protein